MSGWEYKVVPAPTKGVKAKGVKGPEGRFANALEVLMNQMGREGWEFQRAETLPSIERSGLTGSTTEWRNVMVFRRTVAEPMDDFEPELLPPPIPEPEVTAAPVSEPVSQPVPEPVPDAESEVKNTSPEPQKQDATTQGEDAGRGPGKGATEMLPDNGVEETSDVAGMTTSLKSLASQRKKSDGSGPAT
ncbi:MAG: DUF4177 domain-containing protein [Pseudomonadota bacterium]